MKPEVIILADSARGVYIPQHFAESIKRDCVEGVTLKQWDELESGPDYEFYWEVWDEVARDARITDPETGVVYTLHQDGDLFAIPDGMEWDDAEDGFVWPDDSED